MHRNYITVRLAAVALVSIAQSSSAQQTGEARANLVRQLDSLAAARMQSMHVSSLAVGVVHGRDTLLMRAYGLADREKSTTATAHTVYELGSITKQYTAIAIMRLVQSGKLGLDDDVSKYIPRPELANHHLTVRNLLNHTGGIHNYTAEPSWLPAMGKDLPPDSLLNYIAGHTFDFEPGTKYSYSNTGFVMLGMIVEKVTGIPYPTFVQEQIIKPLGLREMYYCPAPNADARVAKGYIAKDDQFTLAPYISMTEAYSAGAMCSSVADFVVFERAFHEGRIVNAASYLAMTTPGTLNDGKPINYGLGLQVGQMEGRRTIAHGGSINGFRSQQLYVPQDSLWVVAFTNSEASPGAVANDLARLTLGLPLAVPGARGRGQAP